MGKYTVAYTVDEVAEVFGQTTVDFIQEMKDKRDRWRKNFKVENFGLAKILLHEFLPQYAQIEDNESDKYNLLKKIHRWIAKAGKEKVDDLSFEVELNVSPRKRKSKS